MSHHTAKKQLPWPGIECWVTRLGPMSASEVTGRKNGAMGEGSFPKDNQDAFTKRRTDGAGRHKQRYPLNLPNTSSISVFILTSPAHFSYYSFVVVDYVPLTCKFLGTDDHYLSNRIHQFKSHSSRHSLKTWDLLCDMLQSAWWFPLYSKYSLPLPNTEMYFFFFFWSRGLGVFQFYLNTNTP